jgi:gamma-glutamyltranspeptidase / glutathione hydrolase
MRNLQRPGRSPVIAPEAMIATSHPLASQVGIDILKSGGNAVDAAIAACATLCVVEPAMTGIGGDCFVLYAPKGAAKPIAMNGSCRAPQAASVDALRDCGVEEIAVQSPHAVTIPGAIAAWTKLNAKYGTKAMDELLAPAAGYAENGYPVAHRVGSDWAGLIPKLMADPVSAEHMTIGGKAPAIGSIFKQPHLAETLRKIGREGRDGFYLGEVAEDIVDRLRAMGGLHTLDDFANAEAEFVDPIETTYNGHQVHECPPNGQGICALMILNILSRHDIGALSEADSVHLMAEAGKLAYHQRNRYITDPNFVDIPVDWLLSQAHAAALDAMIDPAKAGNFHNSDFPTHTDTTYLCCVDRDGNAISFINSLFAGFGSGILTPKSGVMLQNRGSSFRMDVDHVNRIEGGKRPMHTIIPGMVMRDGKAIAPFGVMGGQYQSVGHGNFLSHVLDRGMDVQEAMDAPRSFANDGVLQVEDHFAPETYTELERRGHVLEHMDSPLGGSQCVWIDHENGTLTGGSDPRKDGCAIGY